MNPATRRITFFVFLVVLAAVVVGLSALPGPWNLVAVAVALVAAYFSGEVLFLRDATPVGERVVADSVAPPEEVLTSPIVLTPMLEVPESFQDSDSEIAGEGLASAELEEGVADAMPDEVGPAVAEEPIETPESVLIREFLPLLAELTAEFEGPDPTTVALEEIRGGTDFVKENVLRSYEISDNLANSAKQAFDLSEKVQNGVKIVTDALNESLHQTEVLYQHSQRIAKILVLMSEVSDKIHILSINASIVSARAGILGRGFEVVAKEIRSLAKETENSLGEIEEVIGLLQSTISNVIRVVNAADKETEEEKNSLMAVAGSLQGVILGVEIIRAVSSFAKDKSEENSAFISKLIDESQARRDTPAKAHVSEWTTRLQTFLNKE